MQERRRRYGIDRCGKGGGALRPRKTLTLALSHIVLGLAPEHDVGEGTSLGCAKGIGLAAPRELAWLRQGNWVGCAKGFGVAAPRDLAWLKHGAAGFYV
jgi:hypothetical protein